MDIFLTDPDQVPLPPDEVRIMDMLLEIYPDGKRVRLFVELTPFQAKPSGDMIIKNSLGEVISRSSFIEAVAPKFSMTLHLRSAEPGEYTIKLTLFYTLDVEQEDPKGAAFIRPKQNLIDEMEKKFLIEPQD